MFHFRINHKHLEWRTFPQRRFRRARFGLAYRKVMLDEPGNPERRYCAASPRSSAAHNQRMSPAALAFFDTCSVMLD